MNHVSSFFPDPRGARLHYQYWEASSKGYDRVALVLHGLGYHSGSYPRLAPALAERRIKTYALDFAGFGASPGDRGAGGVIAMADAVETLIRRIEYQEGAREMNLLAHSLGAVAALLFLKRYPSRRARLAAVAPLVLGVPADARPEQFSEDGELLRRLAADRLFAPSVPRPLAADLESTSASLLADPSFLEGRKAAFFAGEADPLVPVDRLRAVVEALPLGERRFAAYPGERHDPLGGGRGAEVMEAVASWFEQSEPAPRAR